MTYDESPDTHLYRVLAREHGSSTCLRDQTYDRSNFAGYNLCRGMCPRLLRVWLVGPLRHEELVENIRSGPHGFHVRL